METKSMLYLVSEYASKGEIFGEIFYQATISQYLRSQLVFKLVIFLV